MFGNDQPTVSKIHNPAKLKSGFLGPENKKSPKAPKLSWALQRHTLLGSTTFDHYSFRGMEGGVPIDLLIKNKPL